jgi:glucosamine 6-phosphate synthetase-like amidotransferase/phosphosugar isomerase protein
MCGILGYIACGKARPSVEEFKKALEGCQKRGRDATGIYSEEVGIIKKDIPAEKFIKEFSEKIKTAVRSQIVLAHCRLATHGDEKVNVNNHPHESENFILIHNGGITKTTKISGYQYKSECDSEIILSYVEQHGVAAGLSQMYSTDSMAIVLLDKRNKNIYLFRNNNPTCMLIDKRRQIIYFGSEFEYLRNFYRHVTTLGFETLDEIASFETTREVLYTLNSTEGLIEREEVKQKTYVYQSDYSPNRSRFYEFDGHTYPNYSGYQTKELCPRCHQLIVKGHHTCTKEVTVNANSTGIKREIIYKNGRPRFIIQE